jgi:hypothetical protein
MDGNSWKEWHNARECDSGKNIGNYQQANGQIMGKGKAAAFLQFGLGFLPRRRWLFTLL